MARMFKPKEGIIRYQASGTQRLELNRNYHVQHYPVRLTITHTNAAGAALDAEGMLALINSIQLIADGSNNIKQIPGRKLYFDTIFATGKNPRQSIDVSEGADRVSYVDLLIPMNLLRTVRPQDTIFNSAIFKSLDLVINWGSAVQGTGVVVTDAVFTVSSDQLIGYKRNEGETIKYFKETSRKETISASTTEFEIDLPTNKLYRGFSLLATVDGARKDDVINAVELKSGTTVIMSWDAQTLKAQNYFNFVNDSNVDLVGLLYIDACERGKISDVINTTQGGFNTLSLVLDVTKGAGVTEVQVGSDFMEQTAITEK